MASGTAQDAGTPASVNGIKVSYEGQTVIVSRTSPGHWVAWMIVTAAGCLMIAVCLSVAVSAVLGMASLRDLALAPLFVVGALLPVWLLRLSFFALLPVRYELRPLVIGGVEARWSLGLLRSHWHAFTRQPLIAVTPAYQRGDWGFILRLHCDGKRSCRISTTTLCSDSPEQAMRAGINLAEAIGSHLGIQTQGKGWNLKA